ncbi:MAG: ribonuclease III domain-containing protein [Peptococcaceae bacterium]|nr:ribonuclease III domain-containing protein [Peptococcaceae bacterium]
MHKALALYSKSENHPEQLPGLTLAFVGDAVYEIYVRTMMLEKSVNAHVLNKRCVKLVNNRTQSALYEVLEPELNDVELGVLHRGRNAKGIVPKNANTQDYRRATAIEALVGYWYLMDDEAHLKWAFDTLWTMTEGKDEA